MPTPQVKLPKQAPGTEPAAGTKLEKLWTIQGGWDLAEKVIAFLGSQLPSFTHSINVMVVGGPEASLRRCWYLAMSAAFGRYRNKMRGQLQSGQIAGTWDVTNKMCSVEIVYTGNKLEDTIDQSPELAAGAAAGIATTLATGNIVAGVAVGGVVFLAGKATRKITGPPQEPADPTRSAQDIFRRGPEQLTIGGNWGDLLGSANIARPSPQSNPTWSAFKNCSVRVIRNVAPLTIMRANGILSEWPVTTSIRSIARAIAYPYTVTRVRTTEGIKFAGTTSAAQVFTATSGGAFNLPDHGRVITTNEKRDVRVQMPAPPIDGATRCSVLALVAQSLQRPCFLPDSPPCTATPIGAAGVWVTAPGNPDDFTSVSERVAATRANPTPAVQTIDQDNTGGFVDGYNVPPQTATNYESR